VVSREKQTGSITPDWSFYKLIIFIKHYLLHLW